MKKKEVVVITGATAGLGRSIVRLFAKRKACIGLIARDKERLIKTKEEVEALGGQALIFPIDVSDADEMMHVGTKMEKEFGSIDFWINNAMLSVFSPAQKMALDEFKRVTDVTYLGYVYGTLSALKVMSRRNKGMIIQVGSALAYRGIPLQSAYCAAKHAVQGFTESVRCELIHDKSQVKISMIQLPAMNTPQFSWVKSRLKRKPKPIPPIFQPEVIAKGILFAAYHYRREWYIGLSTTIAIIGDKLFPSLGDWYLSRQYKKQEYDGLVKKDLPDNLYNPVPGDFEAHGEFDKESHDQSLFLWLNQRRTPLLLGVIIIAGLAFFLI